MLALTIKKVQDGYRHEIIFSKVRNGRQPKPITLERDENLVFQVVEEAVKFPPERVAAIIKAKGGRVNGKTELIEAIKELCGCGDKAAREYIKAAIEQGVIIEIEGKREPGKPGTTPRAYIQKEQVENDD